MILHSYWRSGAAYRVRIGLNLKGLEYRVQPVHLVKNGGEQNTVDYRAINPQGRVPTLILDDGTAIIQSPAILEWLEEAHPAPPLLPKDPLARARIRGICMEGKAQHIRVRSMSLLVTRARNFHIPRDVETRTTVV